MESAEVNGVRIAYEATGDAGPPLVLVHGSWGSHRNWGPAVPGLARGFRVVAYDRRGHSDSERPPGQGSVRDDVEDLAALIQALGLAPAWVAGNSFGACVTLRLAASRPDLLRGVAAHEPPLFALLGGGAREDRVEDALVRVGGLIAAGEHAAAAELFVEEVALGPGSWAQLPGQTRRTFTANAPTYLDELNDPEADAVDTDALARYTGPSLLSVGDRSPPLFAPVVDRLAELLPHAKRVTYRGAGHVPHATHPDQFVDAVTAFAAGNDPAPPAGTRTPRA